MDPERRKAVGRGRGRERKEEEKSESRKKEDDKKDENERKEKGSSQAVSPLRLLLRQQEERTRECKRYWQCAYVSEGVKDEEKRDGRKREETLTGSLNGQMLRARLIGNSSNQETVELQPRSSRAPIKWLLEFHSFWRTARHGGGGVRTALGGR